MKAPTMLAALAFAPLAAEAVLSARHERQLRAAGAVEPPGDVIAAMRLAYPASFAAICVEAALRHRTLTPAAEAGLAGFAAAKALKYSAIATLGRRWTFRVLVPPGSARTVAGPYRWMRHPNYLAVAGEIASLAVAGGARVSGPLALAGFGWLMLRRIAVEERALTAAAPPGPAAAPPA